MLARLFVVAALGLVHPGVAFTVNLRPIVIGTSYQPLTVFRSGGVAKAIHGNSRTSEEEKEQEWLSHGLLFSSFSDGLGKNSQAQAFLLEGLAKALLVEQCSNAEDQVKSSVLASPCNGPDVALLSDLDDIDERLAQVKNHADPLSLLPPTSSSSLELRFVYIPTAMYAVRPESNRTPGKQRQTARADGKKRRDRIVRLLSEMLAPVADVNVRAVTLDLDDGSIKQPQQGPVSSAAGGKFPFPTNGTEALTTWNPHLIYVEGGNTFWLTHCMEKGNWSELLVQVATNPRTVYCGSSAGAILVGQRVETACWKGWDDPRVVPGRENPEDWKDIRGLGLVGKASFFPHMDESWVNLVEQKKQTVEHVECLDEVAVLCVRGDEKLWSMATGATATNQAAEERLSIARQ